MELKIDSNKVLKVAEQCSDAKRTLEILFPEAFEKEKKLTKLTKETVNFYEGRTIDQSGIIIDGFTGIWVRTINSEYEKNAFVLSDRYSWFIEVDPSDGKQVLCFENK